MHKYNNICIYHKYVHVRNIYIFMYQIDLSSRSLKSSSENFLKVKDTIYMLGNEIIRICLNNPRLLL